MIYRMQSSKSDDVEIIDSLELMVKVGRFLSSYGS